MIVVVIIHIHIHIYIDTYIYIYVYISATNTLSCHQKNTVPFLAPSISRINVKEDEVSSSEESNSSSRLRGICFKSCFHCQL